jgi:hypothetical protein
VTELAVFTGRYPADVADKANAAAKAAGCYIEQVSVVVHAELFVLTVLMVKQP